MLFNIQRISRNYNNKEKYKQLKTATNVIQNLFFNDMKLKKSSLAREMYDRKSIIAANNLKANYFYSNLECRSNISVLFQCVQFYHFFSYVLFFILT